jgi:hypothetical protein
MDGETGLTAIETRAGGAIMTLVEPQRVPTQALMVADPVATAYAVPELLESSAIAATALFEVVQITEAKVCGLLPLNVPVATKLCAVPFGSVGVAGVTEMETSPAGAKVAGW